MGHQTEDARGPMPLPRRWLRVKRKQTAKRFETNYILYRVDRLRCAVYGQCPTQTDRLAICAQQRWIDSRSTSLGVQSSNIS